MRNPDPIDYEADQHMRLLVAATANGIYAYTTVWVNLIDINDNPPLFTQDRYVTKVYEEQPKYTYVMQVGYCSDFGSMARLQIRHFFKPESEDIFFISSQKIMLWYSLEVPSNEYPQNTVFDLITTLCA